MKLVLDGPQQMLAQSAADFMAANDAILRLRELRGSSDELGYSPEVWREMADLGWTGIPFAEADDGLGLGLAEVVLITEALGRGLAPEPYVSAVVLAGSLLDGATAEQKAVWIGSTIAGEKRLTVAYQEAGSRYDLSNVQTLAAPSGDGWILSGEKVHVLDGYGADGWIVAARTLGDAASTDGITLFLVPADRAGVSVVRQRRVDSRNAAILHFDGVITGNGDVIGQVGGGLAPLTSAVDRATVALCGEMLGGMSEAFDRTITYLNEREQFGVLIGTFQALKHRAAKMFIERELVRSVVMSAARAVDEGAEDATIQVSNAKARCSDAYILLTNEALQMHGGIGMTDEHDIGLFMKRARVSEMTFGDAAFHRNRFGELLGF
ncbi:MAG: acyl-CoA dehydrogenase family protein [Acidobacteriota bacterium]|nr:acyl-CoA dehydrogenase family protein [Acidobacteriota bacterium]